MGHAPKGAKFVEDFSGKVDGADAFGAGAQKNGQEFRIAQGARAFLEQFLPWPVSNGHDLMLVDFEFFVTFSLLNF